MDLFNSKIILENVCNVYDMLSINCFKEVVYSDDKDVLKEVVQQFEVIFVQMMLKFMCKVQDVMVDEDSLFNFE